MGKREQRRVWESPELGSSEWGSHTASLSVGLGTKESERNPGGPGLAAEAA